MSATESRAAGRCPTWRAALLLLVTSPFLLLLTLFAVHAQQNPSPPVIREDVNLVILPVSVRDRQGHFVPGLQQSNFQVYENGNRQEISLFRNEDVPVTVGLVVDHSGSMAAKQFEVIEGAEAFVQASNALDKEFVINFSSVPSFGLPPNTPFTNNIDALKVALSTVSASGKTALYDAVAAALHHLQQVQSEKKVILLISDGGDNASRHSLSDILHTAAATNVLIYTIGLFDEHSADENPQVLKKLASETGGESYLPTSHQQVIQVCQEIAADIRHQYTLGYNPPNPGRSGYRKIHVKVNDPQHRKVYVRTRAGYFVPAQGAQSTAQQNETQ